MTRPLLARALDWLGSSRRPTEPGEPPVDYTVVFPPTMLWANFQRPHNVLTHLARHHPVRCLFNDWTVREQRSEGGRLVVTKRAFRSRYHRRPLVYYFSIPDKLAYLLRHRLRPDLLVFELMDVPEQEFASWKTRLPEALARADLVRTTGPAVTRYLRSHHADALGGKEITTSYNGVDLTLFDTGRAHPTPPDLRGIEKPILGFYGNLEGWIDWGLIERLAALPDHQVVVIGDTEGRRDRIPPRLRRSPVLWLGRKPVTELPAYLARFRVALLPFVVNEMTDAVDPLKLWEYLALRRPVLATPTAFAEERADLLTVVDPARMGEAGYLEARVAEAAASGDDPAAAARRREAAEGRSWVEIAATLHREIVAKLRARP